MNSSPESGASGGNGNCFDDQGHRSGERCSLRNPSMFETISSTTECAHRGSQVDPVEQATGQVACSAATVGLSSAPISEFQSTNPEGQSHTLQLLLHTSKRLNQILMASIRVAVKLQCVVKHISATAEDSRRNDLMYELQKLSTVLSLLDQQRSRLFQTLFLECARIPMNQILLSNVPVRSSNAPSPSAPTESAARSQQSSEPRPSFPVSLHNMLNHSECAGHEDCIHWSADGLSFVIENPEKFIRTVALLYFRNTSYERFTALLHTYGFERVSNGRLGSNEVTYRHPWLKRHAPEEAHNIRRAHKAPN